MSKLTKIVYLMILMCNLVLVPTGATMIDYDIKIEIDPDGVDSGDEKLFVLLGISDADDEPIWATMTTMGSSESSVWWTQRDANGDDEERLHMYHYDVDYMVMIVALAETDGDTNVDDITIDFIKCRFSGTVYEDGTNRNLGDGSGETDGYICMVWSVYRYRGTPVFEGGVFGSGGSASHYDPVALGGMTSGDKTTLRNACFNYFKKDHGAYTGNEMSFLGGIDTIDFGDFF